MKATYFHAAGALALTAIVAACSAGVQERFVQPAPAATAEQDLPPPPAAIRLSPPPPPIIPEQTFENYLDAPQTEGNWSYVDEPSETLATFGVGSDTKFIVRCDKTTRQVGVARVIGYNSTTPLAMSISTETVTRQLQAQPVRSGPGMVAVTTDARDPLLDAMAITKGRIAVGVQGQYTLYVPAWVEISRVIEDCR